VLAFVHIPKTAGSTISAILRQSFRTQHCDVRLGRDFDVFPLSPAVLQRIGWVYRRLHSIAGHGVVPSGDLRRAGFEPRFYTFLRDPVVRCASEYQYLVQRNNLTTRFDQWIETDPVRNRMTKMLGGQENANAAIAVLRQRVEFVGLAERFDESLVLLRHHFPTAALDIRYRSKNVTRDNQLKTRLLNDSQTREKLILANREDCRLYDHVRESIYPEQVRAYGPTLPADVARFQASNVRPLPYPRQLASLLLRELIYKPLAPRLARPLREAA
jgi:hypothetical protein